MSYNEDTMNEFLNMALKNITNKKQQIDFWLNGNNIIKLNKKINTIFQNSMETSQKKYWSENHTKKNFNTELHAALVKKKEKLFPSKKKNESETTLATLTQELPMLHSLMKHNELKEAQDEAEKLMWKDNPGVAYVAAMSENPEDWDDDLEGGKRKRKTHKRKPRRMTKKHRKKKKTRRKPKKKKTRRKPRKNFLKKVRKKRHRTKRRTKRRR